MRVLLLTDRPLPPAPSGTDSRQAALGTRTEQDLLGALRRLGHEVRPLSLSDSIEPLRREVGDRRPDIVFNLVMRLRGCGAYEPHIAGYLELVEVPYTGSGPLGLTQARDKPLSKQILTWHGVPNPPFQIIRRGRRAEGATPPLPAIVKPADLGCSLGISKASVVATESELHERVRFVNERLQADALVEEYLPGRDLTVGILGNRRLRALPIWETFYGPDCDPPIATQHLKWRQAYRERMDVHTGPAARLSRRTREEVERLAKRSYRLLGLEGFGRVDLRLDEEGGVHVLEVNPNPDLDFKEDLVRSAQRAGLSETAVVEKILKLGLAAARARA